MNRGFDALAINLATEKAEGLANAIHRGLREALRAGRFERGARMPATRQLAKDLGVSRNTIVDVYDRLIGESYLVARHGAGTYVNGDQSNWSADQNSLLSTAVESPNRTLDWLPRSIGATIEFRPGLPDLRRFPIDEWKRTAMRGFRTAVTKSTAYGNPMGDALLREQICKYVRASRGVLCESEAIFVTSGAQQGFDLLARTLMSAQVTIAVEDPGYPPAIAAFENSGAHVATVPVDDEGLIVAQIPEAATFVYVTPSHQFPLGMTMSIQRRMELLDWAKQRNGLIIEDDYDSEFRFGGRRLESLHGMDTNESVIYVGSFSKVLLPAFRLGYLVLPQDIHNSVLKSKWITDRHSSSPIQNEVANFMETGAFGRHLKRMQTLYASRFELITNQLCNLPVNVARLIPSHAGLHVTLLLPHETDLPTLLSNALRQGLGIYPLNYFCRGAFSPGLILGFGNLEIGEIRQGLEILCAQLT